MKVFISVFFVLLSTHVQTGNAFAYEIPDFTSCVNPKGDIKANYETGTHGIAGKPGSFEGKDTVYKLSENSLTQCFCAVDGSGIQTNWWKIPALSASEIKSLEAQGWIYIPNGALWGLENAPYLAKNSDFSCKSSGNGDSSNGSTGSSGSSASSASGGVGQILGLASTGNSVFLLATALTSGLSLLIGLILKKRSKKFSK